jgi:hypothetical protein
MELRGRGQNLKGAGEYHQETSQQGHDRRTSWPFRKIILLFQIFKHHGQKLKKASQVTDSSWKAFQHGPLDKLNSFCFLSF